MPVTLQLAMQLQKLRHLTCAEIARKLHRSEDEIADACRMLLLPLPDGDVEARRTAPSDDARAALRDRVPRNGGTITALGNHDCGARTLRS